jgi:hypothetical protein
MAITPNELTDLQRNTIPTTQASLGSAVGGMGGRTGLPSQLRSGIENLSGYSMDNVQVHYNSSQPGQLQALAYSQGTDIHVGPGGGGGALAHEAAHVVQQAAPTGGFGRP